MARDDGGPAFPTDNERQVGPNAYHFEGMSLRDYFAGQVVAATRDFYADTEVGEEYLRAFAQQAYRIADAMLRERTGEGA